MIGIKLDLEAEVHLTARIRGDIIVGLYWGGFGCKGAVARGSPEIFGILGNWLFCLLCGGAGKEMDFGYINN